MTEASGESAPLIQSAEMEVKTRKGKARGLKKTTTHSQRQQELFIKTMIGFAFSFFFFFGVIK